jgi:hypothetical protein
MRPPGRRETVICVMAPDVPRAQATSRPDRPGGNGRRRIALRASLRQAHEIRFRAHAPTARPWTAGDNRELAYETLCGCRCGPSADDRRTNRDQDGNTEFHHTMHARASQMVFRAPMLRAIASAPVAPWRDP